MSKEIHHYLSNLRTNHLDFFFVLCRSNQNPPFFHSLPPPQKKTSKNDQNNKIRPVLRCQTGIFFMVFHRLTLGRPFTKDLGIDPLARPKMRTTFQRYTDFCVSISLMIFVWGSFKKKAVELCIFIPVRQFLSALSKFFPRKWLIRATWGNPKKKCWLFVPGCLLMPG